MVMGTINGGSASSISIPGPAGPQGIQGPAGPQGPQGPAGPISGIDPLTSALGVYACATISPPLMPAMALAINQWTILNFDAVELDAFQTIQPGPAWSWHPPFYGVYELLANIILDPIATAFDLHVLRNDQETLFQSFTGRTAQIAWKGVVKPSDAVRLEIRPTGAIDVMIPGGSSPRPSIIISGTGMVS